MHKIIHLAFQIDTSQKVVAAMTNTKKERISQCRPKLAKERDTKMGTARRKNKILLEIT